MDNQKDFYIEKKRFFCHEKHGSYGFFSIGHSIGRSIDISRGIVISHGIDISCNIGRGIGIGGTMPNLILLA